MASLYCPGEIDMDYSLKNGKVRSLTYFGEVLVDEDSEKDGWRKKLWEWAKTHNFHVDDGHGRYRAWIYTLAEDLGEDLQVKQ